MTSKDLLLLGAGAVAFWLFKISRTVSLLRFQVRNVGLDFEGINPILKLNVVVQNITSNQLILKGVSGDLYSGNSKVGDLMISETVQIPAHAMSLMTFRVRMGTVGIVSDIVNLILHKSGFGREIRFVGYANVNDITLPVDFSYKIAF